VILLAKQKEKPKSKSQIAMDTIDKTQQNYWTKSENVTRFRSVSDINAKSNKGKKKKI
jgi:hypothetical protein